MCRGCWEEYGSPMFLSDRVCKAAVLIEKVYEQVGGGVGGNLHIVVDDWNLEDDSIKWCMKKRHLRGPGLDWPGARPIEMVPTPIEKECGQALLDLNIKERASALALSEGWLHEAIAEAEANA